MNFDVPIAEMLAILLGACRTGAWMAICPPFNSRLIPGPVKALLSVAMALPMAPYLTATLPPMETSALIASVLLQIAVGIGLGAVTALLFAALPAAGDLLDLFGGFQLATAYDPMGYSQSSIFGRLYNLIAITLLFVSDGHQLILRGFLQSFRTLPLDTTFSMETFSRLLLAGIGEMFLSALQIAGPLICVLFLSDVALGLLNRVAPALNAFQLGFPVKILLVVTIVGLSISMLPGIVHNLVERAVAAVLHLSGA
jgi:flagellar biosynthetic protein FliR